MSMVITIPNKATTYRDCIAHVFECDAIVPLVSKPGFYSMDMEMVGNTVDIRRLLLHKDSALP